MSSALAKAFGRLLAADSLPGLPRLGCSRRAAGEGGVIAESASFRGAKRAEAEAAEAAADSRGDKDGGSVADAGPLGEEQVRVRLPPGRMNSSLRSLLTRDLDLRDCVTCVGAADDERPGRPPRWERAERRRSAQFPAATCFRPFVCTISLLPLYRTRGSSSSV